MICDCPATDSCFSWTTPLLSRHRRNKALGQQAANNAAWFFIVHNSFTTCESQLSTAIHCNLHKSTAVFRIILFACFVFVCPIYMTLIKGRSVPLAATAFSAYYTVCHVISEKYILQTGQVKLIFSKLFLFNSKFSRQRYGQIF